MINYALILEYMKSKYKNHDICSIHGIVFSEDYITFEIYNSYNMEIYVDRYGRHQISIDDLVIFRRNKMISLIL